MDCICSRVTGRSVLVGEKPLRRSESPFPSLKREMTSSERGSPGWRKPRFCSEAVQLGES